MNRITTYIRQSLQDIYPPEEVKALSMLICCDMLGVDALDIYMGKDIILSECKQREIENIIFRLQKNETILTFQLVILELVEEKLVIFMDIIKS